MKKRRKRTSRNSKLDTFTRQYMETALWSSTDEDGEPLDRDFSISDFSPEAKEEMIKDCKDFQESFGDLYSDSGQAGHDFWLTRNRHGVGFWDDPETYGEANAKALTDAAHAYGEQYLIVGDDGQIHLG